MILVLNMHSVYVSYRVRWQFHSGHDTNLLPIPNMAVYNYTLVVFFTLLVLSTSHATYIPRAFPSLITAVPAFIFYAFMASARIGNVSMDHAVA